MGDTKLSALTELRKALDRAAARRAEAAKVVEEIEAPRRRLAQIEQEEQEAEKALAQAERDRQQWQGELEDCAKWLKEWEPREGKIAGAIEVLDALGDDVMRGGSSSHISASDLGRCAAQLRGQLEYLANQRAARARLESALRKLGA
jgi:chromosome segregation ATPase